MHPTPINSHVAGRGLTSALKRHAQLLEADQSDQDKDRRPGFISMGENGSQWSATVSGTNAGGSYSLTQPMEQEPSDTVTFTGSSMTRMITYRNYDGKKYMTTTHVDRADLDNSWEVTRVIDKESIWQ